VAPAAAERSTADQQAQVIADLVQTLVADPGSVSPLGTLQELRVPKGTLVVHDQRLGATWHVTQCDLTLRRQQHGLTGTGRLTLADQVVTLRQLRAHGGALGLTAAGNIDIPASSVDVQGTIIPLYGINTVLGKVPIVGDLVLGGKGQGLIAITARVTGRLADPQVSVNPASAVTPGFVRGFSDLFTGSSGADSEPRPRQE